DYPHSRTGGRSIGAGEGPCPRGARRGVPGPGWRDKGPAHCSRGSARSHIRSGAGKVGLQGGAKPSRAENILVGTWIRDEQFFSRWRDAAGGRQKRNKTLVREREPTAGRYIYSQI